MSTFFDELDEIVGPRNTQAHAEARLAIEIAVQFAALRERRGLTQKELAERLGRTQQAVSKIENPSHGGHNLARLKAAVAELDATLDVTIVPLEDLPAYEVCRVPKPTLEDIQLRAARESPNHDAQHGVIRRGPRTHIRPSSRPAAFSLSSVVHKKASDLIPMRGRSPESNRYASR